MDACLCVFLIVDRIAQLVLECVALDAERVTYERRTAEYEAAVQRRRAWERVKQDEAARMATTASSSSSSSTASKPGFFASLFGLGGGGGGGSGGGRKEDVGPHVPAKAPDRPAVETRVTHRVTCWCAEEAARAAKLVTAAHAAMQTLWTDPAPAPAPVQQQSLPLPLLNHK